MVVAVGYLLAVLSSVFNGSFVAFAKVQSVASVNLHPILFNFYVTCGVAASSCLAIPWVLSGHGELRFVYEGAIGGFLFVGASSLSFVAAKNLGLSTGQGVWSGSAITVAFLWGVLGPEPIGKPLGSLPLSLLAMLLLLLGVAGMVKCQPLGRALDWRRLHDTEHPLHGGSNSDSEVGSGVRDADSPTEDCALQPRTAQDKSVHVTGLCAAVGVGLFGGSILVPLTYLDDQIAALPSFGLGALVGGALLTAVFYAAALRRGEPPALELRSTLWAGLASGLVWNAGNLCQIVAMSVYALPYGISYPILQARPHAAREAAAPCIQRLQPHAPHGAVTHCRPPLAAGGAHDLGHPRHLRLPRDRRAARDRRLLPVRRPGGRRCCAARPLWSRNQASGGLTTRWSSETRVTCICIACGTVVAARCLLSNIKETAWGARSSPVRSTPPSELESARRFFRRKFGLVSAH